METIRWGNPMKIISRKACTLLHLSYNDITQPIPNVKQKFEPFGDNSKN